MWLSAKASQNRVAYRTRAALMSRFVKKFRSVPRGPVALCDAFGQSRAFGGRTDAQRGAALARGIEVARSRLTADSEWSQAISLSPGVFDLQDSIANLNKSTTVGISLTGAGARATTIRSSAAIGSGPIVVPGGNSSISSLNIKGTAGTNVFQATIGAFQAGGGNSGFKNVQCSDLIFDAKRERAKRERGREPFPTKGSRPLYSPRGAIALSRPLEYFDPRNTPRAPISRAGLFSCVSSLIIVPLALVASVQNMIEAFRPSFVYSYWSTVLLLYVTAIFMGLRGLRDPRRLIAVSALSIDAIILVAFALRNTIWADFLRIGWTA
jgi:hypothetical protein